MSDEEFQTLAMKFLSGETTPDEKAALDAELTQNPARQAELEEWRETLSITRSVAPMLAALETKEPELPRHRMGELRSAVRTHFQKRDAAAADLSPWTGKLLFRLLIGAGIATAALVFALTPGPSTITIGYYAESATRSLEAAPLIKSTPQIHISEFDTDSDFEQWCTQPFSGDEKARIWLDDEHDLIHVRVRGTWFHGDTAFTQPLPADDNARRETLQALFRSLSK